MTSVFVPTIYGNSQLYGTVYYGGQWVTLVGPSVGPPTISITQPTPLVIPAGYTIGSFSAIAVDYATILVTWNKPSAAFVDFRLVRNRSGFPVDENDGTVLIDTFNSGSWQGTQYFDSDVIPGTFHYYGVYILIAIEGVPEGVWYRAGLTCVLAINNYGSTDWLLGRLPEYYKVVDNTDLTTSDALGNSYFEQFISILGWGFDYLQTQLNIASNVNNAQVIPVNWLANLAGTLGFPFYAEVDPGTLRNAIDNFAYLIQQRGTLQGIEAMITQLTGWGADIRVGYNQLLEDDQSHFTDPLNDNWNALISYDIGEQVSYGGYNYTSTGSGNLGNAPFINSNPYFSGGSLTGYVGFGASVSASDAITGGPGVWSAEVVNSAADGTLEGSGAPYFVDALAEYTVTAWVYAATSFTAVIGFDWDSGTGTYESTSTATQAVTGGTWTQISTTQQAPADAVLSYPRVGATSGSLTYYVQAVLVTTSSTNWWTLDYYISDTETLANLNTGWLNTWEPLIDVLPLEHPGTTEMTITAAQTAGEANGILLRVLVLTQASVAGSPATADQSGGAAHTADITTTVDGSIVYGAVINGDAAALTYETPQCIGLDSVVDATNGVVYGTFYTEATTDPEATLVGSPASYGGGMAAFEVLPSGGAITVSATSPAVAVTTSAQSVSTAAFTPPEGSIIIALVASNGEYGDVTDVSVSGGGLNWTQVVAGDAESNMYAGAWIAGTTGGTETQFFSIGLYSYPPSAFWTAAIDAYPQTKFIIANVDSGPGTGTESNFQAIYNEATAAGIELLGYVYTNYGARSLADCETDINNWYTYYGIRSIFFDECATSSSFLSYYQSLASYVHSGDGSATVMVNPGAIPDEGYFSIGINIIQVEENSDAAYPADAANAPAWLFDYPSSMIAVTVNECATQADALRDIALAASAFNAMYVWVTSDGIYNVEPSYFTAMQDYIKPTGAGGGSEEIGPETLPFTELTSILSPNNPSTYTHNGLAVTNNSGETSAIELRSISRIPEDLVLQQLYPSRGQVIGDGIPVPYTLPSQAWQPAVYYPPNSVVTWNGSPFLALKASTGSQPPENGVATNEWQPIGYDPRIALMLSGYTSQNLTVTSNDTYAVTPYVLWFDETGALITELAVRTPTNGAPGNILFDSFSLASNWGSALQATVPDIGSYTWQAESGQFQVNAFAGGSAVPLSMAGQTIAVINYGSANAFVGVTFASLSSSGWNNGLIIRWASNTSYIRVDENYIVTNNGTVSTVLAEHTFPFQQGDRMTVSCNGNVITVYKNGSQVSQVTTAFNNSSTYFGLVTDNQSDVVPGTVQPRSTIQRRQRQRGLGRFGGNSGASGGRSGQVNLFGETSQAGSSAVSGAGGITVHAPLNPNAFFTNSTNNWTGGADATFTVTGSPPAGGPYPNAGELAITNSGGGELESTTEFAAYPGQVFTVTCWLYCATACDIQIGFDWRTSTGSYVASALNYASLTGTTWTSYTYSATVPLNAQPIALAVVRAGATTEVTLYIEGLVATWGSPYTVTGGKIAQRDRRQRRTGQRKKQGAP
jgi:phage tail-like protein